VETSLTWLGRLTGSPTEGDWRQLLDAYGPLIGGWLARSGVPSADRDDLVQEVLLVVVREVAAFDRRRPGAFRGWLRMILANRVRDYFRGRAGRAVAAGGSEAADLLDGLTDPESAFSAAWDREHDEHVAGVALARVRGDFTAASWEAFDRHALRGQAAKEVAAALGMSVNAVLIARSRILRRVREELAGLVD
jgi:RNA polymerase sigma-70 factor (ECF subfamily)